MAGVVRAATLLEDLHLDGIEGVVEGQAPSGRSGAVCLATASGDDEKQSQTETVFFEWM